MNDRDDKIIFEKIDVKEYYLEDVLTKNKRFPKGIWKIENPLRFDIARILTKTLIEEVYKWSPEEVIANLTQSKFVQKKLGIMFREVFNCNLFNALDNAYPGQYYPWQLTRVTKKYWNKETAKLATKWVIEKKLKWNEEEIIKNLTSRVLVSNGLSGMLNIVFNNRPFEAIDNAYPGRFKIWQFSRVPDFYWNEDTAKEAIRWLIDVKFKWNKKQVENNLNYTILKINKLNWMLKVVFDNDLFAAIECAYPGVYQRKNFKALKKYIVKDGSLVECWNEEKAKEAIIYLIEEKLKWSKEEVAKNLTRKVFRENGLGSMFNTVFNNSTFAALECVYPKVYKPWLLKQIPKGYWDEDTAKEAVIWLVEEQLHMDPKEALNKLTQEDFKKYRLSGMLSKIYYNDIFVAITSVYSKM